MILGTTQEQTAKTGGTKCYKKMLASRKSATEEWQMRQEEKWREETKSIEKRQDESTKDTRDDTNKDQKKSEEIQREEI